MSKCIFKICAIFFFTTSSLCGQTFDYPSLIKKIQDENWNNENGDTLILDTWVRDQLKDGSWTDFEYGKVPIRGSNHHVMRLLSLAKVCTNIDHPKYNNEPYKNAIRTGLHFWVNSKTYDSNWWRNQIGWPKELGVLMLLMRQFPAYLEQGNSGVSEKEILALFKPTAIADLSSYGRGANMFDFGFHYIYRGILTKDSTLLMQTSKFLEKNLLSNLQTDLSFHEHGPQLQISSYGAEYQKAVVSIAYYLAGTPAAFDINGKSFSTFLRFIKEVQIPSIRGQFWDYSVLGRGISRVNSTKGNLAQLNVLRDFIDPDNAEKYNAAQLRITGSKPANYKTPTFNKHYWKSDYTHHSRPDFLFTVRNVSKRTVESETGNDESLKGNYLSYGANFIAVDGDEYHTIMPVWDWSMIPGITARQTTEFAARKTWGANFGATDFVGGVSANEYGAAALDMDFDGTVAKKSWFMFKDEIVCLGSSIGSEHSNVNTTINQCNGAGAVYYSSGGKENKVEASTKVISSNTISWIRHDKTAYFFPENRDMNFSLSQQSGSWKSINGGQSSDTLTQEVFKLWVKHGNKPVDSKYAYIIVPNILNEAAAKNYSLENLVILANTKAMQSVYHKELKVLQTIFYEAGTIKNGGFSLTVDKPCIVQVENETLISVSDPSQVLDNVKVNIIIKGKSYSKSIDLPGGDFKGSTITTNIN